MNPDDPRIRKDPDGIPRLPKTWALGRSEAFGLWEPSPLLFLPPLSRSPLPYFENLPSQSQLESGWKMSCSGRGGVNNSGEGLVLVLWCRVGSF